MPSRFIISNGGSVEKLPAGVQKLFKGSLESQGTAVGRSDAFDLASKATELSGTSHGDAKEKDSKGDAITKENVKEKKSKKAKKAKKDKKEKKGKK